MKKTYIFGLLLGMTFTSCSDFLDKMPDDLRAAQESNDLLIDSLYRRSGFDSDSERLQELFRRYKEATSCQR